MPVLETERQSVPRSALRYRPINTNQAKPLPGVSRQRRSLPDVLEDFSQEEQEQPTRRRVEPQAPLMPVRRRFHPLFWLGLGALSLLLLWAGISQLVTWGTNKLNDLNYGYPRLTQMDGVLGLGDSVTHPSHLLALNLHGEIIIEVFPAGDVSRMKAYTLTTLSGPGSDRDVVSLRLIDPGQTGKPDIVVQVGESVNVLVTDGQGGFRQPSPAEQRQLLPYLQN